MMALKHDAQGFLAGDPIDIGHALTAWDDIREDVRAIRRAITEAGTTPAPGQSARGPTVKAFNDVAQPMARSAPVRRDANQVPALLRKPATPQTGGAGGNSNRRDAQATAAASQAVAAVRASGQIAQKSVAKPAARDGRGRFVCGTGGEGRAPGAPGAGGGSGEDGNGEVGVMRSIADRIVGAVKESGSGMEEADPAVKAFNEVAQPMARGYELMTGGDKDKRQEGWLRRIYTSLAGLRNEETVFNKAANKSLKNISEKPEAKGGGDGGGMLGMMSGLLSKIPGVGPMLAGGARMMGGVGKGLMGAGKGLLRRIPLLGALIGGVGAASDIYSSETDDSLTRREKDQRAGKAAGGFAGSVGGMLAGAKLGAMAGAIGGPIGVAIGGVLGGAVGMFFGDQAGQIIGDTVGGWVSDLREADIPGKIVGAWDATTEFLKKGWGAALDKLEQGWKSIKEAGSQAAQWAVDKADAANNFIKDKTGVDVKDAAVAAKGKAVEVGTRAVEGAKAGVEYLGNNTTVGKGIKVAGNWVLGQTSKLFESGKGGAETVSAGKGDYGGASYGTYQLSSKQGEVQKFLKSSKYGDQFAGLQPGTPEFNAKWKEVAKADPEFGNAQHDYIKATKFDPAMAGLKKSGIDLSKDGAAVQDAIWSTSVQFGADGAQRLVKNAFKDKDVSKMTEAEKVSAIQDYKIANNEKLFSKSDDNVRAGTARRAVSEKERLLALAGQQEGSPAIAQAAPPQAPVGVVAPAAPVVASASAPPVSVAPSIPALAEAPPITVPMASGDSSRPIVVAAQSRGVGQDLRERGIAHIVTGGLSHV